MFYAFLSLYPFMVCLFWTAVLLMEWRDANPAKRMLTLFMGVCTTLYLCHALFFNALSTTTTDSIYIFCNIAVFPLYLIYIYRLTGSRPLSWRYGLLLVPALLVGIANYMAKNTPSICCLLIFTEKAIFILQLLSVCWIGMRRLHDFDLQIENFFSNTELRSVKHTRYMMAALAVCSLFSAIASIIGREHFFDNPSLLFIPSLSFGTLLFIVGFVGQKQEFCADTLEATEPFKDCECSDAAESIEGTEKAEDAEPSATSPLLQALEALMQSSQLFLMTDLRLSDVAAKLNVSRTTLSTAINQNAGVSFSDYVNGFRVRHAQNIMRDNSQSTALSIVQIAEQSGFTSESSFYRAFRKYTGVTPKQWMVQNTIVE